MVFHFPIFLWTAVLYVGLQLVLQVPGSPSWGRLFVTVLPLLLIAVLAARRLTHRTADAYLPGLLALTAPVLLSFVAGSREAQYFVLLYTFMFYFSLLGVYRLRHAPQDKTAQAILSTAAMAGLFFFFASLYGFYLNFSFPLWGMMLLFFFGTALTSYETFAGVEGQNRERVRLYSVLLGLMMAELSWAMSFWPFGYLTTGALAVIFYFIAWDTAFDAFRKALSLRRALIRFTILFLIIILLLVSTPWRILV